VSRNDEYGVALRALRRTRQKKRLGDLEWFDAAYRVYLVALFGGGSVLWLSSVSGDQPVSASAAADILDRGPAVLGLIAVFALAVGLRGGAQGGPLALEGGDVAYVMMSPVDRWWALVKPATQRLRSAISISAASGAIAGQLAGRRLPGSPLGWAGGGFLFGVTVAFLWVGGALVAHAIRLPRWAAAVAAIAGFGWQAAAIAWEVPGLGDRAGSIALWGWRQHAVDLLAVAAAVGFVVAGFAMLRRISLDALSRRANLVAQLRFAVTMQDLRTVILLRRQLNVEQTRGRPWVRVPRFGDRFPVWRRSWQSLSRLPASRLLRMAALAAAAGVTQAMAAQGTTSAVVLTAVSLFILGLEVMEPLAQEVDQPDRTDGLPVPRGELMARLVIAPAIALLPFAVIAAAAATAILGSVDFLAATAVLAFPTLLAGAAGAVVSIVRDAPDPFGGSTQAFMPPEMAGFNTALRTLLPIIVSGLGALTVLIVRQAHENGDAPIGAAVRGAVGAVLLIAAVLFWVRKRDAWRAAFRKFMAEGRAYTTQQRSSATPR
jgi:hypothetical protein